MLFHGRSNKRGNITLITALVLVPILSVMAFALELSGISTEKSRLQAVVDAAALAGGAELSIPSRGNTGIETVARQYAIEAYRYVNNVTPVTFRAIVDRPSSTITVTGKGTRTSFMSVFNKKGTQISATATAELLGTMPLCVLQTNYQPTTKVAARLARRGIGPVSGFTLKNDAKIQASDCMVQSNDSIISTDNAEIDAGIVQAVKSATGKISPQPNVGALPIADPFERLNMNPPARPKCVTGTMTVSAGQIVRLSAGVHCDTIVVESTGVLELAPGEHYFYSNIVLSQDSALQGSDVVLFFNSDNKFDFGGNARVELSARTSGRFAGFLIVTHRLNYQSFTISSNNVRQLLGTIYIPRAELIISSTDSVAQESAWSVIVARAITLTKSPVLVINSRYLGSGVPPPKGVGPKTGSPRLKS